MLNITCWGTRGSIPVSGPIFSRHGGATTCLEINPLDPCGDTPERVIIDCGTGLADLGRAQRGSCKSALFLQTHVHWDHIQGFPFFAPLFDGEARFEFLCSPHEGKSLCRVLADQMRRPLFPVDLDALPAKLSFEEIPKSGHRRFGELQIRWAEMCHPSGSTAYRIDYRGSSVVFSGDVEVQLGSRVELVELSRGADLLIMDGQYFPDEYEQRRGFGHSTPIDALDVAVESGVGRLLLTHHDPTHDDRRLDEKLLLTRQIAHQNGLGHLQIDNARDGMRVSDFEMTSHAILGHAPGEISP